MEADYSEVSKIDVLYGNMVDLFNMYHPKYGLTYLGDEANQEEALEVTMFRMGLYNPLDDEIDNIEHYTPIQAEAERAGYIMRTAEEIDDPLVREELQVLLIH